MSNLSDLLPAGASAKQLTFTDRGSGIASTAPCVLESAGTVSPIAIGADSAGTPTYFSGSSQAKTQGGMASNGSGEFLYAYRANNGYGTVQVVSYATPGGSITYGTPVTFLSSSTGGVSCAYDAQSGYYVVAYTNSGSNFVGEVRCVSVSGTTPTAYTASSLSSYPYQVNSTDCEYDPTQQMTFVAYDYAYDDGSTFFYGGGQVRLCQPSSAYNPPTLHGNLDAVGGSSSFLSRASMVYDSSVSKTVIHFCDTSGNASSKIISVSGTSLSFSSSTAFNSGYTTNPFATYDSNQNAQVVAFRDSSNKGYVIAGTTGASSLTYGTEVEFSDGNQVHSDTNALGVDYDATAQKVVIVYADDGDSDNGKVVFASVSGTTVTVTTPIYLDGSTGTPVDMFASAYDATGKRVIVTYRITSNDQTRLNAVEPGATNLTATNFVGVADSAISASAAGSVIVQGGTVGGISLGSGVSLGATSTVEAVNPLSLNRNGLNIYDSTNNKHIIVYLDEGASYAGHGAVGTISGTTVSYGTPVVFQSQNLEYLAGAYDSTNEKVLVCYRGYDTGQSFYLHGVVGTVSGTSISWGTPTALNSVSSYLTSQGVQFDSNAGKFLVCYQDGSANSAAAALVATVSGTSVSAGTPVTFDAPGSPGTFYQCASYDANAQKFLVTWTRQTNYYIYAAVATISGTSVSFGTTLNWYSATSYYQAVNYDSNAQKHLSVYNVSSGNWLGAAVATISGTDVTYGSGTTFVADSIASTAPEQTYDSTAQQMLIFSNVGNSSPEPIIQYAGTISGTNVTVSSGTTILSGNNYLIGPSTYNSSANKTLVLWELSGTSLDSAVGTLGDLPLTVGTKYYVTTTGAFSSSADTPSVSAGLAISTTSLLLNGDS